jgi:hypothetical protein
MFKRCYLYLNKNKIIKFELRIFLHSFEHEIESRKCRDAEFLFEDEIESRKCQNVKILLEKSIVNENWFQKMFAIEFIIVKIMILKQSKKRRTFFRKRKFDVLIEFI